MMGPTTQAARHRANGPGPARRTNSMRTTHYKAAV
jgi:hypothetical protein